MTMNILNDPELLFITTSNEGKNKKLRFVPFEFRLDDIVEEETKCPVGDTKYRIKQIVSYSPDQFFGKDSL